MSKEKQKHTPGPWFINGPWHVQAESMPDDCRPQVICQMTPHDHGRLAGKREANARLIAAAPELYSALQLMLEKFQDSVRPGEAGWDAIEAARSAIHKVEAE